MRAVSPEHAEVYSPRELARAAGVPVRQVDELVSAGLIETVDGEFIAHAEAVRVGRRLAAGLPIDLPPTAPGLGLAEARPLFVRPAPAARQTAMPAAVSSTLHAVAVGAMVLFTSLGLTETVSTISERKPEPSRLVYLNIPGPGGGGGGGGMKLPTPPRRATRKGTERLSSPMPVRTPPPPVEPPPRVEPPKPPEIEPEPLPPVQAPIASLPSEDQDRAGTFEDNTREEESRGPGDGGGVGDGRGTGIGEGDGSGVGPGSGGGTGGGPYRPGSGIVPPRLLRELKANYTEEARRQGIEGDVLLEIVVRHDGTVGDVRVMRGLGAGLDERAVQAVRQWRFTPATRFGSPVDVLVEVAVEFRLR